MSIGKPLTLESFFSNITLPTLSEVAQALIKTLDDECASPLEVRNIIAQDPALCARLLKLANSAHFGLPRGVGNLDEAIAMVGMAPIRNMALAALMNDAFPATPGWDLSEFWRSSMRCASCSQWLAISLQMDGQLAWLAGMMLRLGDLLIGQTASDTRVDFTHKSTLSTVRWNLQKQLIGFTEGDIMAELARRWHFPMQIMQALQRAADPLTEQAYSRLGAVLHLASCLADTSGEGVQTLDALPSDVVHHLGLDLAELKQRFPELEKLISVSAA